MSTDTERPQTAPTKSFVEVLGIALLLGLTITMMMVFNNAAMNGGKTVVDVNAYGEMFPELLLLQLVIMPIISVGLYEWHRR